MHGCNRSEDSQVSGVYITTLGGRCQLLQQQLILPLHSSSDARHTTKVPRLNHSALSEDVHSTPHCLRCTAPHSLLCACWQCKPLRHTNQPSTQHANRTHPADANTLKVVGLRIDVQPGNTNSITSVAQSLTGSTVTQSTTPDLQKTITSLSKTHSRTLRTSHSCSKSRQQASMHNRCYGMDRKHDYVLLGRPCSHGPEHST